MVERKTVKGSYLLCYSKDIRGVAHGCGRVYIGRIRSEVWLDEYKSALEGKTLKELANEVLDR